MNKRLIQNLVCQSLNERVDRTLLKSMLLRKGRDDVLSAFKAKACSVHPIAWQDYPVTLELVDSYEAPTDEAPCFLGAMHRMNDGNILCVETHHEQMTLINWAEGAEVIAPKAGSFFSFTSHPEGFVVLSSKSLEFRVLDKNFFLLDTRPAPKLLHGMRLSKIVNLHNGFAVYNQKVGKVLFLDEGLNLVHEVETSGLFKVIMGTGYGNGVVMIERALREIDYGELVWFSQHGDLVPVAGGFHLPFSVTANGSKLIVCDCNGVHILDLDGLSIKSHKHISCKSIINTLDLMGGQCHEAILHGDELVIKFDIGRSYLLNSQRYLLAKFRIIVAESDSGPDTRNIGC